LGNGNIDLEMANGFKVLTFIFFVALRCSWNGNFNVLLQTFRGAAAGQHDIL
jgi:hypothetical protein